MMIHKAKVKLFFKVSNGFSFQYCLYSFQNIIMDLSTIMTLLVCAMIIHIGMVMRVMAMLTPVDILMKNRKVTIDFGVL